MTGLEQNLDGFDLEHLSLDGRVLYRNAFQGARLADDDIAVAALLDATGAWVRGDGPPPYPLADGCQDHLLGLAIEEAGRTGEPVRTAAGGVGGRRVADARPDARAPVRPSVGDTIRLHPHDRAVRTARTWSATPSPPSASGFDFEVSSDHYFPWLDAQGHAPHAWTLLGAVAQATERVELMTYVTCPTLRYHPAVVAQKAATLGVLSDGRFLLNVGAGENLNEHVVGERWPAVGERHDMLEEAVEIIRELLTGDRVNFAGDFFQVDSAKVWDLPDEPDRRSVPPSPGRSRSRGSRTLVDHLVAVEPDADAIHAWDDARGARPAGVAQDRSDPDQLGPGPGRGRRPRARAVPLVRAAAGRSTPTCRRPRRSTRPASSSDRPTSPSRSRAARTWTRSSRRSSAYWEAGFTDIAIVQVGDEQQDEFLATAAGPLLEKLRAAAPTTESQKTSSCPGGRSHLAVVGLSAERVPPPRRPAPPAGGTCSRAWPARASRGSWWSPR